MSDRSTARLAEFSAYAGAVGGLFGGIGESIGGETGEVLSTIGTIGDHLSVTGMEFATAGALASAPIEDQMAALTAAAPIVTAIGASSRIDRRQRAAGGTNADGTPADETSTADDGSDDPTSDASGAGANGRGGAGNPVEALANLLTEILSIPIRILSMVVGGPGAGPPAAPA